METILIPWKTNPKDESQRLAYELINAVNFLLQRMVEDQKQIHDIITNRGSTTSDILQEMGTNGKYWLNAYSQSVVFVNSLANTANKSLVDIAPAEVTYITDKIIAEVDDTVKIKEIVKEIESLE